MVTEDRSESDEERGRGSGWQVYKNPCTEEDALAAWDECRDRRTDTVRVRDTNVAYVPTRFKGEFTVNETTIRGE